MSEGEDDKVEVKVVVESKDSTSKVILISLTLVLLGILIAVVSSGGVEELLPKVNWFLALANTYAGIQSADVAFGAGMCVGAHTCFLCIGVGCC